MTRRGRAENDFHRWKIVFVCKCFPRSVNFVVLFLVVVFTYSHLETEQRKKRREYANVRINRLRERAKTKSVLWWIFSYSNDHMVGPKREQQKKFMDIFSIRNESTYEHIIHIYEFMRNGYCPPPTFTTTERSRKSLGVCVLF